MVDDLGLIPDSPQRSTIGQLGHYLGLVNRKLAPMAAATTAGGALGLAGGPFAEVSVPVGALGGLASYGVAHLADLPAAAYNNLKPQGWPASPYPGQGFDDVVNRAMGNREMPETGGERIASAAINAVGDAASGSGLGSLLKTSARPAVQAIGNAFAAEAVPKTLAASGVSGGAAGLAQEAFPDSPIAPIVAGIALPAAIPFGFNGVRSAIRGGGPERTQNMVDLFHEMNSSPTVGQATGSRTMQGIEGMLSKFPFAGGVFANKAEEQSQGIQRRLMGAADSLDRSATATSAGRKASEGVTESFLPQKRGVQSGLYDKLDTLIDPAAPVATSNFGGTLGKLTTPVAGANGLENSRLLGAHPDIQELSGLYNEALAAGSGNLSFGALKDIRSRIGEKLQDFSLSSDTPRAQLKQLYGALSQDMATAAKAAGPQAEAAYNRANTYTRALNDRLDLLQNAIGKAGGPEKIFEAATAPGTNKFGATPLSALMKSIPEDARRTFASAFIRERLGRPNASAQNAAGDAFSTETFLTNWSKVSPEAKRALFGSLGNDFVSNMDKVAQSTSTLRDSSKFYRNNSGSGLAVNSGAVGAVLGQASIGNFKTAAGFAAPLLINWAGARAMTSPGFVRWLAKSDSSIPRGNLLPQLDRLAEQAKKSGDEDGAQAFLNVKGKLQAGEDLGAVPDDSDLGLIPDEPQPTRAKKLLSE